MKITIALSKGRIFEQTIPLLERLGITCNENPETSRKLILDTNQKDIKLTLDAQLLEEDQVINQRHELETLGVTKVPLLKIPKVGN
jgi:ATP phosphoribosyltransferase